MFIVFPDFILLWKSDCASQNEEYILIFPYWLHYLPKVRCHLHVKRERSPTATYRKSLKLNRTSNSPQIQTISPWSRNSSNSILWPKFHFLPNKSELWSAIIVVRLQHTKRHNLFIHTCHLSRWLVQEFTSMEKFWFQLHKVNGLTLTWWPYTLSVHILCPWLLEVI